MFHGKQWYLVPNQWSAKLMWIRAKSTYFDKIMTYSLKNIVPWGRTFDEYQAMFALTPEDLKKSILGCADGPASFNAELTARNGRIISTDPLYTYSKTEIKQRIDDVYDEVLDQARQNQSQFVWDHIPSVEALGDLRMGAMNQFLADYEAGKRNGRYQTASLPHLPFENAQFDLALCSHFLFLYSEQLSEAFHLESIKELKRVAKEIRIFPLLDLTTSPSKHLNPIIQKLQKKGFQLQIQTVPYEFQRGGNQMLTIWWNKYLHFPYKHVMCVTSGQTHCWPANSLQPTSWS